MIIQGSYQATTGLTKYRRVGKSTDPQFAKEQNQIKQEVKLSEEEEHSPQISCG
jgi:hypothetical protein